MKYCEGMQVIISSFDTGIITKKLKGNFWQVESKGYNYLFHEDQLNTLFKGKMICCNCGKVAEIDPSIMCSHCWCKSLHQGKPYRC